MTDYFLVETTNEGGIVVQMRVSVNETELDLGSGTRVRIDGLERATRLRRLYVQPTAINAFWCRISRILALSQLFDNRFVDVPACVLALTQLRLLDVSLVRLLLFLRRRC
jgi:hypothetical protein